MYNRDETSAARLIELRKQFLDILNVINITLLDIEIDPELSAAFGPPLSATAEDTTPVINACGEEQVYYATYDVENDQVYYTVVDDVIYGTEYSDSDSEI